MTEKQLIEQVTLIYPYVAQELTADENPDILAALTALEAQGLIVRVEPTSCRQTRQVGLRAAGAAGQFGFGNAATHVRGYLHCITVFSQSRRAEITQFGNCQKAVQTVRDNRHRVFRGPTVRRILGPPACRKSYNPKRTKPSGCNTADASSRGTCGRANHRAVGPPCITAHD